MVLPDGFVLAAVLEREDPRDAWVSPHHADIDALPRGARVGTSSLRRVVQLKAIRPDLDIQPLRGNLDTRLRKLDEGQYDGIVLAAAGLKRLGLAERIRAVIDPAVMLPAAGQGALGIEVRQDAMALRALLAEHVDVETWLAVHAERAVSRALGGSCSMPLAAYAQWQGDALTIEARLGHPLDADQPLVVARAQAPIQRTLDATIDAEALGLQVVAQLRAAGGDALLAALAEA
jgi:hydroxymethylbilane synthase